MHSYLNQLILHLFYCIVSPYLSMNYYYFFYKSKYPHVINYFQSNPIIRGTNQSSSSPFPNNPIHPIDIIEKDSFTFLCISYQVSSTYQSNTTQFSFLSTAKSIQNEKKKHDQIQRGLRKEK